MKILLDENVSAHLLDPLKWLLWGHSLEHVDKRWKGIKDKQLYEKAARHGYEFLITVDSNQLFDNDICKAIQRSGVHCAFVDVGKSSLDHLAAAAAALVQSSRAIVAALEEVDTQRIVLIRMASGRPYKIHDPRREPPSSMWPRKQYGNHWPPRRFQRDG
ncbi:hypothetical protein [Bailinhaonella thermotolerans]|uniref:hypothetical protein n=1 Tax=Bailinhaonella thermotolerans TaxID=1070861 RepID=UPI0011C39EAE|nr:hypothetical protein [Bailinhaonella thermotolerans]